MKRAIKSKKNLTISQVFFFNGSKLTMEVVEGKGTVEFDESVINPDYLEAAILSKLHLGFDNEADAEVDTEALDDTSTKEAEVASVEEKTEEPKADPEPKPEVKEKKTTTKKKAAPKKKATRKKK